MAAGRMELLKRVDSLFINECRGCPNFALQTSSNEACEGCEVYKELNAIGKKLDANVAENRKEKRKKQLRIIENSESEYERDKAINQFILDNHVNLSNAKLSKELGITEYFLYKKYDELNIRKEAMSK